MDLFAATYDKHTKIWKGCTLPSLYNIEHHSIGKILFNQMRLYPNKVILIDDHDGTTMTNGEVLTAAKRIALHLKKQRMRHDDIVGISARNTPHVTSVVLGCFFNCTPYHGVNPFLVEENIAHCYGITKPQIIFCDGCDYEKIKAATKSFKPIIYTLSEHIKGVPTVLDLLEPTKEELFYLPEKLTLGADQTVAILCSSGTTGLPKAVTISANKVMFDNPLINSEDVYYTTSAVDWISGLAATIVNCNNGCTRIISRKSFSADYFMELTMKYKLTYVLLAPVHVVALTQCPKFTKENGASLKALQTGGGYISTQTLSKVQSVVPQCLIFFGYGSTEIGGVSTSFGVQRGNSVGKLMPNIQLRIVDDNGQNLPPNQVGEIYVRYPWNWMGYYGNPKETQRLYDSLGWFHSGDLGYMDEDGFLYVVDRKKDIFKYQALHYWPGEIENAVRELPEVVDCCVVAIFDENYGDVPGALVVKSKGSQITEQQIVNHVKERLKDQQKQLHNGVYFVDQLPHNQNGKVLRREAKEIFQTLMKLDR